MSVKTIVITGVGKENSLGTMICEAIWKESIDPVKIIAICEPGIAPKKPQYVDQFFNCDLSDVGTTLALMETIAAQNSEIYALINCAGMNKMDWFDRVQVDDVEKVMRVNCLAPIFAAQGLLGSLINGTILNIVSMGAHKPFRTSLAYNISKAALKMATHQMARELKMTHNIDVFAISPNELDGTAMTQDNLSEIQRIRGWSAEEAEEYRKQNAAAERTDPLFLADFIAYLMKGKMFHKMFNGVDIYYGD